MNVPTLFDQPLARLSDPETAHQAAQVAGRSAGTVRARCLVALQQAGTYGLTDFELADRVGRAQTSAGVRRGELVKAGLVEWSGETRPAPSGTPARVWRAV